MKFLTRALLVLILVTGMPLIAVAAVMSVAPTTASVHAGDIVTVRLVANTQGVAINQGEATLRFPTDMLDVVSVSKSGSIFTLWVEEPGYSNTAGTVHFDGGVPTPGYTGTVGSLLAVTFHAKREGTATLSLTDAALRANDGLGTDVLTSANGGTIAITQTTPQPVPSTETKPVAVGTGVIRGLTSPTHSDEDTWYQNASPLLTWQLPGGATAVQTIVDKSANATPTVTYAPPIVEKRVANLADGIWYFNVRAKTSTGWGPVSSYKLQIDSTAPLLSGARFAYDEGKQMVLISGVSATDATSGVDHFEFSIDGGSMAVIPPEKLSDGMYAYPYSSPGAHTVVLSVFDRAGNHSETSGTFTVPQSLAMQSLWNIGGINVTFGGCILFVLFIALLALAAAGTAWYKLYTLRVGAKSRIEKRDKLLHRSLRIYKEELERHLRTLERAGTRRELTDEEADLNEDLKKNVDDLERYLSKEFKKYD